MAYISGRGGTLTVAGVSVDLQEWDAEISSAIAKGATSATSGWQVTAEGIHSWTFNFTVAVVAGSIAAASFREGALVAVVAGTGGGGISGNVRVEKISSAVKIMGTDFIAVKASGAGDGLPTLT